MKMAQPPPDQNFYHPHSHPHPQLQLPPQFRNPFDLLFDERTGAINYNYIRPYIPNQIPKPVLPHSLDDLSDSLVMRRPRRTRTTFTSAQIAELEQHFQEGRYLTTSRLAELSVKLALGTAQVKIWFKNRRRRHKIQSDQQKDFSCDGMPLSPSAPNAAKPETHGSGSSCGSNTSVSSTTGGPPSLQSLNINGCGGSTPNTLTPSPTPTTPTANLMEHYGESAFNPYYYNNHHASHPPHHHQVHPTHATLTHPYAAAATQYYSRPPPPGNMQHHPHQHQHQQHQQQQQHQHQQQYHAPHPHQFQMQQKSQATSMKEDSEFNFNNPYYMRMPTTLADNSTGTTVQPSTAMSPNSEVYEPLTPKNDDCSSLCNGVGGSNVDVSEKMKETKTKLQVLVSNNANGNDNTCSNGNAIGTDGSSTPAVNIMEDCNGAYARYQKVSTDATDDPNYQCTMDTLMHAYNNHRNTTTNTQQFAAYCFN